MTTTYLYYPEASEIREQPRMQEPDVTQDILGELADQYNEHIAFLKSYPAEGFTCQHEGRELLEGKDFRLQHQCFVSIYNYSVTKGEWIKCSETTYNVMTEIKRRIIAIPIEPAKEILSDDYQTRVNDFIQVCFGEEISKDINERNHRFIEEALELIQSTGAARSECHQLVDYVYGRPVGETAQEVGGVMVTLAALCNAIKINMNHEGDKELKRVWTTIEKIRTKQAAKPKYSPLPQEIISDDVEKTAIAFADFIRKKCRVDFYDKLIEYNGDKFDAEELYHEWQKLKQQRQ